MIPQIAPHYAHTDDPGQQQPRMRTVGQLAEHVPFEMVVGRPGANQRERERAHSDGVEQSGQRPEEAENVVGAHSSLAATDGFGASCAENETAPAE